MIQPPCWSNSKQLTTGGAMEGVGVRRAASPAVAVSVAGSTGPLVDIAVGAPVVDNGSPGRQLLSPSSATNMAVMIRVDKIDNCVFIKVLLLDDEAGDAPYTRTGV